MGKNTRTILICSGKGGVGKTTLTANLGVAFAGKGGNKNASIASLYLNPLQLRIADVIAIGPKDKPKNFYPEIALIDKQTIIIKPHLIESKN